MSAVTRLFKRFRPRPTAEINYTPIRYTPEDIRPKVVVADVTIHAACIDRQKLIETIDKFVSAAETSQVWTRNERRAVRCVALYMQQQFNLPVTYGP